MAAAAQAYSSAEAASEEKGMGPGASLSGRRRSDGGVAWASLVAILFAAVAAISFAVDQSVTLSDLSESLPVHDAER
jgi:hypothetical protein